MEIDVHKCADGGVLYEFYREEGFGQLAVRTVLPGKTVGGHLHPITNEFLIFFKGDGIVYTENANRIREMRHVNASSGPVVIPLPAGTGHDIKNVGEGELAFIFFSDRLYDPKSHDKVEWHW